MLKLIFYMFFMIPLCFNKKNYWLLQNFIFLLSFIVIIFFEMMNDIWVSISYFLGVDYISLGLILLSCWISSLMFMASSSLYNKNFMLNYFSILVLFLLIFLIVTFSSMNLFLFYFFFESSLIPVLLLIMGWGYQSDRMQAGLYLLFYTLLASLPLLMGLLFIYEVEKSLYLSFLKIFSLEFNFYLYLSMIMAFLVKMPMYFVHLWLPKAHVEAPISGSMILAGIMLKLGGYGLIRVFSMMMLIGVKLNFIFIIMSMVGGIIVSFICLYQFDLKSLIAYSSVVHMSMVISGIMVLTYWGISGAYLMMISHGLCSSGLFCLANIMYERLGSRSLMINKGLLNFMPSMSLFWFLLCSSNMSAPPSLNLLSEIMLINSMISWNYIMMVLLIFLSFFSALYSLYLYSYSQHGKLMLGYYSFSMGFISEYLLLLLHWVPLNLMILKVDLFVMI
uniref:NADH-ubiquinone oxidoreductase chain 4 n=1 Tax=Perga condei TaxID=32411 RepID=Q5EQN6_9HYME|nr:NADH dehydrogenase subunit 4 [Perga condei]